MGYDRDQLQKLLPATHEYERNAREQLTVCGTGLSRQFKMLPECRVDDDLHGFRFYDDKLVLQPAQDGLPGLGPVCGETDLGTEAQGLKGRGQHVRAHVTRLAEDTLYVSTSFLGYGRGRMDTR